MENQKQTGVCRYCGQVVVLSEGQLEKMDWDRDEAASFFCSCPEAGRSRQTARDWEMAQEKIGFLFVDCEERGLDPVTEQDLETARTGARMVCSQLAEKVTLQLRSGTICQIGRNAKWEIIIKRTDTRSSKA